MKVGAKKSNKKEGNVISNFYRVITATRPNGQPNRTHVM